MNTSIFIAVITAVFGLVIGYALRRIVAMFQKRSLEAEVETILAHAKTKASDIVAKAIEKSDAHVTESQNMLRDTRSEIKQAKDHLQKREDLLDKRQIDLDHGFEDIKIKIEEIRTLKENFQEKQNSIETELEKIAELSPEEARKIIFDRIERESSEDISARIRKMEIAGADKFTNRAREILLSVIQRLASPTATEATVTSVEIESEDAKGRIIGREGRNIKAFERVAGVELIIDESPNEIIISSFDPIRRQIARVALEELLKDGRIQPAKIEEFYEKAKSDIHAIVKQKGEEAVTELGIYTLDPRVIAVLGRLHFRTSYGQNVLKHSIEVARLCEMLAAEVGADPVVAKIGGLVHDIGKALDHELEGTHVQIGIRVLEKFETDPRVVVAMKSHHDEFPHESLESVIVQVCDQISGARPGARRDTLENYIKRLKELEAVANSFPGVEKSYALSAGREIRVFVTPTTVSDIDARNTARNMALKIEKELRYPGEIKVTVIRENRVIEYAR
jgi:ribonucrease Y